MMDPTTIEARARWRGCLLGLACGDAVGTTVEFSPRGSFPPVTDMVGGGPFALPAGAWTDDTSMALCLATSLVQRGGFDARDQMNRYLNWWNFGYLSATNQCFDIGMTVSAALLRYQGTREPMAGDAHPRTAGNGSLMRLAPVAMAWAHDLDAARHYARLSSATTHAAPEALACCEILAEVLVNALAGKPKSGLMPAAAPADATDAVRRIVEGDWRDKPRERVLGSGYCVRSLEAALWCVDRADSFEEAILEAANLGDDADTTAAIAGQIAGALHGEAGIPARWRERLVMAAEIGRLADRLYDMGRGEAAGEGEEGTA